MKKNSPEPEKDPGKDLQKFEQQPPEVKKVEELKDRAEKSSGQERIAVNEEVETKAKGLKKN